jgi:hypothetical protein
MSKEQDQIDDDRFYWFKSILGLRPRDVDYDRVLKDIVSYYGYGWRAVEQAKIVLQIRKLNEKSS